MSAAVAPVAADVCPELAQRLGQPDGCERLTRRRGEALVAAIREAALEVLAEVGFDRLTMDLVADRAQTSKRVLYRRWPNKVELVVDALEASVASRPAPLPDTGELRGDLVALLGDLASMLRTRDGNVMVRLSLEVGACPELRAAGEARLWGHRRDAVRDLVRRAVARGQARPGADAREALAIGPALLMHRSVVEGKRVTRADVEAIVDHAWLPALRA